MIKIAFIGAGSLGFTRGLVRDVLTFPLLQDATLSLMDIDPERLEFARKSVQRIIDMGKYPARVTATLDRVEALRRCRYRPGHHPVWQHRGLALRHRDPQAVWGGYQRRGYARTVRDLPRLAHHPGDAGYRQGHGTLLPEGRTLLNYTNPMAMLCRALQRKTFIRLTGLCHSVQGTAYDALLLDRSTLQGNHLHLRRAQPHGMVPEV